MLANPDGSAVVDLRDLLEPLLCLDMTLAEVVAVLFETGADPAVIASASGNPSHLAGLLRRLADEQAWREAKQQLYLGEAPRFSEKIARMADVIEATAPG